ncbi:MAG: hypothetical protein ACI9EF_002743 [Pseudohongiellaceae bacterium]|jgi:hypothetical protein
MSKSWLVSAALFLVAVGASPVTGQSAEVVRNRNTPEPVTGHQVIDKQLHHLQELIVRLRVARSGVFMAMGGGRAMAPVSGDAATQLAAQLRHELNQLEESLLALRVAKAESRPGVGPIESISVMVAGAADLARIDLPEHEGLDPLSWEIANVGSEPISNPRVVFEEQLGGFDVGAVERSVLAGVEGDLPKAQRLWEFLVENRFHSAPPSPRSEVVDPIKLINVYGYCHADGASGAFAALAGRAGLEVRLWKLNGHVVAEVLCDDSWRMFDCDAEVFYRGPSGGPASVADLQRDPALLDHPVLVPGRSKPRYSMNTIQRIWSQVEDHHILDVSAPGLLHDMGFVLRPGERIVRQWGHQGLRVPEIGYQVPESFANGQWIYEYALAPGETPPIELDFDLPYPIVAGRVSVRFSSISSRRDWVVEARTQGAEWQALPWGKSAMRVFPASIGSALGAAGSGPDYTLNVRVAPTHQDARATIDWVRVELVFQLAPQSLPRLHSGRNDVRWVSESPGAEASIHYRYRGQDEAH